MEDEPMEYQQLDLSPFHAVRRVSNKPGYGSKHWSVPPAIYPQTITSLLSPFSLIF